MAPRLLHAWHLSARRQPPPLLEVHHHPWHELILVLSGRYAASCHEGRVDAPAGAAVHWPAGLEHRLIGAPAPPSLILIQYREAGPQPARRPRMVAQIPPRLMGDARRILTLADERAPRLRRAADALLDLVLWQLEAGEAGEPPLLQRLRTLVMGRITERWPLPRLAAELRMSVRHLHRRLRAEGTTPRAAVAALRVEKIMPDLTESALTLAALGRKAGIASRRQVARLVRAGTGLSPAQLRRRPRVSRP